MASLQHIHLVSLDKYKLFNWYEEFFDFKIIEDIEKLGEKNGPLFISADEGKTAISIFNISVMNESSKTNCIPAFSYSAEKFVEKYFLFLENEIDVKVFDHYLFYSFYTNDPEGTRIELCTFDIENAKALFEEKKITLNYI